MRLVLTVLFAATFSLLNAQSRKNVIAYYHADSILPYMPLHTSNQDSLMGYKIIMENTLLVMKVQMGTRQCNPVSDSSAKDTPLISALRAQQQAQTDSAYKEYAKLAEENYRILDSSFKAQEMQLIKEAALAVIKRKRFSSVHEYADVKMVLNAAPRGSKSLDITELVMKEMKLR